MLFPTHFLELSIPVRLGLVCFFSVANYSCLLSSMSDHSSEVSAITTQINLKQLERWEVYQRLRDLEIPCQCSCHEPLEVELNSPLMVWQFWNVMRRVFSSRKTLAHYLEQCWQLSSHY